MGLSPPNHGDSGWTPDMKTPPARAVSQARYRLRSAKYHSTFPPYVPARVIGELVLAREELVAAQDAVARWIDQHTDRRETLDF